MALANVGTWLYRKGHRVLLVDWDLEAPGLESFFFHDEKSLDEIRGKPGLIDLVESYRQLWESGTTLEEKSSDAKQKATDLTNKLGSIQHLMVPLDKTNIDVISTRNPGLWLLPAGCRAGDSEQYYTKTVNAMDWGRFYAEFGGFVFLEWLRRQFENDVDIVLIDSRTGITEMGGVCTQHLADIAMLLFAPNYSNLHGVLKITEILLSEELKNLRGSGRPISIFPIPARVDIQGASNKLEAFENQFKNEFSKFRQIDVDWCWESKIPYITNYSYEEQVLFMNESDHSNMRETYERIGNQIAILHDESLLLSDRGVAAKSRGVQQGGQPVDSESARRTVRGLNAAAKDKIDKGEFPIAENLLHSSLALAERDLGDENQDTLRAKNMLATVLNYQDKFIAAKELWEQLVTVYRRLNGEADPLTLISMTNLAVTLRSQGDFVGALKIFEQALFLHRRIFGEEHPDTLTTINNLSETLGALGDLEKAKALQEQALEVSRRIFGEEHPDTLTTMNNLSETLRGQGVLEEARSLQEKVLDARIRILGEEHPDTIMSRSNLGSILREQGDLDGFRFLEKKVREFRPRTVSTIYLSSTYEDLKDYRQVVYQALRKGGYQVIAMEDYLATDQRPVEQCLRDVEMADIYVGLFGHSYGYVPPTEHGNPDQLSITELEFRYAEKLKKPCLIFIAGEDAVFPIKLMDNFTGDGDNGHRINVLRQYLLSEKLASIFSSPHELASLVLSAVTKNLEYERAGVKSKTIEWPESKSPYPGLEWFDKEYAPVYFGRDREVDDVIAKMSEPQGRFLLISGASGSGKSSLVAAGLWHALAKEGRLPGSKHWLWLRITPGDGTGPLDSLAWGLKQVFPKISTKSVDLAHELAEDPSALNALLATHLTSDQELLLFVDQLEELFTKGFKDEVIQYFLTHLVTMPRDPQNRLRVVSTVRSEYIGKLEESETAVLKVFNTGCNYHLGPVSPRTLQVMIEQPAQAMGYEFEPHLVDEILDEAGKEPGILPLLAYTMKQIFERRQGRIFTREAYRAIGGLVGSIGTKADQVMETLDDTVRGAFDKVFAELVHLERDRPPTRKRVSLGRFSGDAGAITLIQALGGSDCRLLVMSGGTEEAYAEIAHEKLFTGWRRLYEWIQASGEALRGIEYAEEAAKRWHEMGSHLQELWLKRRAEEIQKVLNRFSKNASPMLERMLKPQQMLIERLKDGSLSHDDRLLIGKKLAEFGDPRAGVGLRSDGLPDIAWIEIPGGRISMENVDHAFEVKPFRVAKYPVINMQFQAFIDDGGYQNDIWWEGLEKLDPSPLTRKEANSPREMVSWYEAVAFCRWLSDRTGTPIRLPTEWEWQQAATGGDPAHEYPWAGGWDHTRCNGPESYLNRTTAVGLYPRGATKQGVMDMAGNVREWCLNTYEFPESPKSVRTDTIGGRVLRGGSWSDDPDNLRTSHRSRVPSGLRSLNLGFRLVQDTL